MTFLRTAFHVLVGCLLAAAAHAAFQGRFLDRSFGVDGTATLPAPPGMSTGLGAMTATRDGGLVFVGFMCEAGSCRLIPRVTKLRSDGSSDPSFGHQGSADLSVPMEPAFGYAFPSSVHEDSRGRMLVGFVSVEYPADFARCMDGRLSFGLLRLHANGVVDPSFGNQGVARWATTPAPACEYMPRMNGIVERPGGQLVFYGSRTWLDVNNTDTTRLFVVQMTAEGWLDASFGVGGVAEASIQDVHGMGPAQLGADGILAGVISESERDGRFQVRRWRAGSSGELSLALAPGFATHPHQQPDGTFIVVTPDDPGSFAFEFRDAAGRLLESQGRGGRIELQLERFRPTSLLRTADGGSVARGYQLIRRISSPWVDYRQWLCFWRSDGWLQACEEPFPNGHPGWPPDSTTYLGPDGRVYVVERTQDSLTGVISTLIGRFEVPGPGGEYPDEIPGRDFSTDDGAQAQAIDRGDAGPGRKRTAH